ncbi:response regulator transcription factor [Polaribacter batillariae]|uniref:Response regulator transcription factor n=1 Tax=Polaribacter batillariae TaxID=2808900 RepID=A0ABX7SQQ4_9FLAO|nr:response regulator transcription factor [Polaribacter batillariae]QTD36461.1 response regulator transcription factor [Polaribacter batillariae]
MNINCLIIDDEPASQEIIQLFIRKIGFLSLTKTCNNAVEALNELKSNPTINLIFLDINMPKISGLSFYKSLQNPPLVIFTTAYPQYAVDGFNVNAVDYLLKPFSFDRFLQAVNKVTDKLEIPKKVTNSKETILIKADKKLHKIKISSIFYIEAFGDYVKIHLENKFLLTNNTFKKILSLLPEDTFFQVHKSFAISLKKVNTVEGNQIFIDTKKIPIGSKYKSNFLKKFKNE